MGSPPAASEPLQPQPQALHYTLANAQQVQIHQIGEDGQVQVVCTLSLTHSQARGGVGAGRRPLWGGDTLAQGCCFPGNESQEAAPGLFASG